MVTHAIEGFKLTVDRGPNWLFVKLQPKKRFAEDVAQIADELWSIASRHFIYRLVLELEELPELPVDLVEQLVILQERLLHCDGSLRICGLSDQCVAKLRKSQLESALPNYATRQEAVLGSDASALHEKLKKMLAESPTDGATQSAAAFSNQPPSWQ